MRRGSLGDLTQTEAQTTSSAESADNDPIGSVGLTILSHPDPKRVGDRVRLPSSVGKTLLLSRLGPEFAPSTGGPGSPLGERRLSRTPLRLTRGSHDTLRLDPNGSSTAIVAEGQGVREALSFHSGEIERGVVLLLGNRVTLLLHYLEEDPDPGERHHLIGESTAIVRVRREIKRVAALPFNVLVRGESGTGKELVAQALHEKSPRQDAPFVAVNLAAVPSTLAAAELFGAAKGAYSGADRHRRGAFQRADGGTLFLDEIGETSIDVQVLLLRAIETSEIQPVGADSSRKVDVRIVAATDADLEAAIEEGRFRSPLLHRLASYEILLSPLRDRREDFGRLFYHFLRLELEALGAAEQIEPTEPGQRPWVPASLVADLALGAWPGNVRQLCNVVRQLAVANLEEEEMRATPVVKRLLGQADPESTPMAPAKSSKVSSQPPRRDLDEIPEDDVRSALRQHRFEIAPTAKALQVSRPSVYNLLKRYGIRTASELGRQEIEEALRNHGDDIRAIADEFRVSKRGLKIRIKELKDYNESKD